MYNKGFILAVIVLFIGVSFQPIIAEETIAVEKTSDYENVGFEEAKEYLFQTIIDMADNQEIQRIILKSQMSIEIFPESKIPILTKNQLRQMYLLGVLFSRFISTSRIQSLIQKYQLIKPEIQKEISAVIEKDATLNSEVTQILNSECDCDNEQTSSWGFPILCSILNVLMIIPLILFGFGSSLEAIGLWFRLIGLIGYIITMITVPIVYAIIYVGTIFDCNWWFISI